MSRIIESSHEHIADAVTDIADDLSLQLNRFSGSVYNLSRLTKGDAQ